MARTVAAVKEFSEIILQHNIEKVRVVGTEALRTATNRVEFSSRLFKETGLELEIIPGEQEAFLTVSGVCSAFNLPLADSVLVFDIGGGSTEFILLLHGEIVFKKSCQLGVVDLSETLPQGERRTKQIGTIISVVSSMLEPIFKQYDLSSKSVTLVGTAGTVTTLAAMDMEMLDYDWQLVNGHILDLQTIKAMYRRLADLTVAQREELPGMEQGRGDLIPAGIEIILEIMQQFKAEELTVSDFGLLEGVLLSISSISRANR
jgi:exopolyphosphatase/guanosine-5'-triphosphate,3'-diphosphate pyrophosphatase